MEDCLQESATILSPDCVVRVVVKDVESEIQRVLPRTQIPAGFPEICHSRVSCATSLISYGILRPSLWQDTFVFVSVRPVCACSNVSCSPSASLLRHLPIPYCSLSHISLDFVTGLPSHSHLHSY